MAHITAYKTLDDIIKTALDRAEEDISKYIKYYDLAVECYTNLRLNHIKEGDVVEKLSVNSNLKTVDFPDDMVDYIAIGIPINGELWTFTKKHGLIKTTSYANGQYYYDTDIGEGEDILQDNDDGYSARGGVNTEGYFDVDFKEKRFVLKNTTATTVWLAYITRGIDLSQTEQYINIKYEKCIISYIIWQSEVYVKGVAANRLLHLERQYEQQLKDLRNSEINLGAILDLFYELYHLQRRL